MVLKPHVKSWEKTGGTTKNYQPVAGELIPDFWLPSTVWGFHLKKPTGNTMKNYKLLEMSSR